MTKNMLRNTVTDRLRGVLKIAAHLDEGPEIQAEVLAIMNKVRWKEMKFVLPYQDYLADLDYQFSEFEREIGLLGEQTDRPVVDHKMLAESIAKMRKDIKEIGDEQDELTLELTKKIDEILFMYQTENKGLSLLFTLTEIWNAGDGENCEFAINDLAKAIDINYEPAMLKAIGLCCQYGILERIGLNRVRLHMNRPFVRNEGYYEQYI